MLLIASYVFYGAWDWRYLSLILMSTTVDYFCALGIEKSNSQKIKKKLVALSLFANLSLLGVFKYYDFFAENFAIFFGNLGFSVQPYFLDLVLPVGISFYTFQTISYTIDVYRKKVPASKNYLDFALYVSFFPQLIAGPIERGTRLLPQIIKPRKMTFMKIYHGGYFFLWGLFLKVFIADNLAKLVDPVFQSTGPYDGASVLLATYAFSFQIYCDFAGYSFMAIGLALCMGIHLMENFRRPYFSRNISEFWRRWHISLSSWFRDYLFTPFYIYLQKRNSIKNLPLKVKHGLAFWGTLLVTEYLLGLWHGAGWNFAFFGIYHGLAIGVYYYTRKYWDSLYWPIQIFLTYQVACVGWLIFRATSLTQAQEMLQSIFFNFHGISQLDLQATSLKILGFTIILIIIQIFQDWKNETLVVLRLPIVARTILIALLMSLIITFGDFGDRPFIYFQF
jgi:alginate O-acetyltransferase complex protein AlgI